MLFAVTIPGILIAISTLVISYRRLRNCVSGAPRATWKDWT
jgi:hypothetical protein